MTRPQPSWIVFDLDDTLIDRTSALEQVSAEIARECGVAGLRHDAGSLTHASMALARVTALAPRDLQHRLRRGIVSAIRPRSRLTAWLRRLSRLQTVIIASNGNRRLQHAKLRAAGLAELAPQLVTSAELRLRKPDPAFFTAVFTRFGADPEQTLVVGNDARLDVEAAVAAGARAVRVSAPTLAELQRAVA